MLGILFVQTAERPYQHGGGVVAGQELGGLHQLAADDLSVPAVRQGRGLPAGLPTPLRQR